MRLGHVSKYRAERTPVDGILFASKKEATRYGQLKLLQRIGEIQGLVLQPEFPLHAVNLEDGELVRVGAYRADFQYLDVRSQLTVIEDTKGFRTPLYVWKKKHVECQYHITIQEL